MQGVVRPAVTAAACSFFCLVGPKYTPARRSQEPAVEEDWPRWARGAAPEAMSSSSSMPRVARARIISAGLMPRTISVDHGDVDKHPTAPVDNRRLSTETGIPARRPVDSHIMSSKDAAITPMPRMTP